MSKRKMKAAASMSVVLASAVALAACSGGSKPAETNGSGTTSAKTESKSKFGETPLEFTFYGHYDWFTMKGWGQDPATKWIQDNKKVTVKPIHSGGNSQQKFNTMIASKDLPDVLWLDRGPDVEKLRAAGQLVAFDDYLDKYPNLKKWAGDATLNLLRSSDGKLYQFPNWYTTQPNGNAGYIVNKKIYDALGKPKLETFDDLYAYLKQVKEKYPNVVPFDTAIEGQGVEILFTGFKENYPATFINIRGVAQGNEIKSLFADPVYLEAMQFASKLFREKLITQDAMTQKKDQIDEKVKNGRVAVLAASDATQFGSKADAVLKAKDPNDGYFMVWPLHKAGVDKNKVYPGHYSQLGWNVNVITKAAKDPEAIFAFLDWMTGDEGSRITMWGPEGLYWQGKDAEGAPNFTDKFYSDVTGRTKLMDDLTASFQWVGNTTFVDRAKTKIELKLPPEKQNWETRYQAEITWKTQFDRTAFLNLDPSPQSQEGLAAQRVKDLYKETLAKALYAKSDEEVKSVLEKTEKDAQAAGYDKLLKFKTEKWQENLKKIATK